MSRRRAMALALVCWVVVGTRPGRANGAETPSCDGSPGTIELTLELEAEATLLETLARELDAALARQRLRICGADRARSAPMSITVAGTGDRVAIHIQDRARAKTAERTLELGAFPPDARALAIALAGSELLRTHGFEPADDPATRRAPSATNEPPLATPATTDEPPLAARARGLDQTAWTSIGVGPSIDRANDGTFLAGVDLYVLRWWTPRLALELSLGARRSEARPSTHGAVQASQLGLGAGFLASLLRWGEVRAVGGVGVRAAGVLMEGLPSGDAQARRRVAPTLSCRATIGLVAPVGARTEARISVIAGVPALGVRGLDEDDAVVSLVGVELGAFAALGVRL